MEILLPEISSRTTAIVFVDSAGRVFLPLRPVLTHTGILHSEADSVWSLQWPLDGVGTTLDLRSGRVQTSAGADSIAERSRLLSDGELYLETGALGRLLGAQAEIDWESLVVILMGTPPFPAVRTLQIEAERAHNRLRGTFRERRGLEPDVALGSGSGGFAMDWGVSALASGDQAQAGLRGVLGGAVLGGALEAGGSVSLGVDEGDGGVEPFARYTRIFPQNRWLQQLRLGAVYPDAPVPVYLTGAAVTNAPFRQAQIFGEVAIRPAVPTGWEYEVYEGDYLVGVSDPQAPEGVLTTIGYGANPIRIRLIGPSGEERTEQVIFFVPQSRLAPGELRYNLGAGRCRERCESYGYGDLQHGLAGWLSVGGGVDRTDAGEGDISINPYALVSLNPRSNLSADLQARRHSFTRVIIQYYGERNSTAHLAIASHDSLDALNSSSGWRADASASNVFGGRWLTIRTRLQGAEQGSIEAWQASVGAPYRRGYVSAQYETGLQARGVLSLRASATPRSRWNARLSNLNVFGLAGLSTAGVELVEAGAAFQPQRWGVVSMQSQWRPGASFPSLTLSYSTRLPYAYAQLRTALRQGGSATFASLDGGVSLSRDQPPVLNPFGSVSSSGVTGRVFVDRDGDGEFDVTDEPIPGAPVLISGLRVVADSQGVYRSWMVQPYQVARVSVDSLSLDDPELAPVRPEVLLRPTPNIYNRVDLALVRTREVLGRVIAGAGVRGAGGVSIEILDEDGTVVAQARTFSDGEYYIRRIRPGSYHVRVADTSLRALGGRAQPESVLLVVDGTTGQAAVETEPIVIVGAAEDP